MNFLKKTRFKGLLYRRSPRCGWSFIDGETHAQIGAWYASERELLADLESFATGRGFPL